MGLILLIIYLVFCWFVAYAGRRTRLGFFGLLILSVFITPLVAAIFMVLFQPQRRKK